MDAAIVRVVKFLERNRIRATYAAVGSVVGVSAQSVGRLLGERCPLASWLVNEARGEPTGYAEHQKHPELHLHAEVITSGEELAAG